MNTLPTSLVRFQSQLEEAVRDRAPAPRRLALRSALALTVAAAVALGVLGALPGNSPSTVERAAAALQVGDSAILHTAVVSVTADAEGGSTTTRVETWQAGSPPFDQLQITSRDGQLLETAIVNGVAQLYDPETETIHVGPADPRVTKQAAAKAAGKAAPALETGGDFYRAKILSLLEAGKIAESGRSAVDGRDAIRLVSDDGSVTLLVDAVSYRPIEWRVDQQGKSLVARFPTYEHLSASDSNAALLSLAARHPGATIDRSPAAYEAARQRLVPDKG